MTKTHTVASAAGAGASDFVTDTIAGADLIVAVNRTAGGGGYSPRGVLHNVQVPVAAVRDRAVAAEAVAGSEPPEALAHAGAVVAHASVGALQQVAAALVGEVGVVEVRELAFGAHRDVVWLHRATQPAAAHDGDLRLRPLRQNKPDLRRHKGKVNSCHTNKTLIEYYNRKC